MKAPEKRGVGAAFVAPFWADIDTREGPGRVYFRSTDNQTVLDMIKRITDKVLIQRQSCLLANTFSPKWALVATWFDVGYYEKKYDKVCIKLCVWLASSEIALHCIFSYIQLLIEMSTYIM